MRISVKVSPNSKREEIFFKDKILVVKVREKAINGQANKALIKVLADFFRVGKSNVKILTGQTSRRKLVEIKDNSNGEE